MMNLAEAISLLTPFHIPQVICVVHKASGKFDAQLTTGNPDTPTIAINDSMVTAEDVFEAIDSHTSNSPIPFPTFPQEMNVWGVYAA